MKIMNGDGILIPIDAFRSAVGIVAEAEQHGLFFVAVLNQVVDPTATETIPDPSADIVLFGKTMDSRLHSGDWSACGRGDPKAFHFPFPWYQVGLAGQQTIVDQRGQRREPQGDIAVHTYPFLTSYAPMRFEKAIQAYHGCREWNASYEGLLPVEPRLRQ